MSLGILLVNAVCAVVLDDVVVAALDIVGAQVMVEGVTALVHALLDAAVCHLVGAAATASLHHIEDVRNCHMLTGMA